MFKTMRDSVRLIAATCIATGLLLPVASQAFCGFYAGKADASLFNEASQVILVRDGKRTVISMLNDYKGPLNQFALIVPTPVALKQGQVRIADKLSFERLDAYSSPRLAEYNDNDPCRFSYDWGDIAPRQVYPMAVPAPAAMPRVMRDKALGVTVEARYTLEEYDIVSLSAKQSDGLETWLHLNGYKIPKGASAALRPYINQGMKFFVAKVNLKEQQKTGYSSLRPLQFAFESDKFMLPMRLGMLNAPPDKAQDLIVYVMSRESRVESSNYRTVKLPANINIPQFVKPKFQDFYKALFDNATRKEDYRVVFTEYFWNMGWCDPCAANPLSTEELRKAGAFWVGGDANTNFDAMTHGRDAPIMSASDNYGGAQPVMLTRLHVRYTPSSFPEDLMFSQTKDQENWQTRYVIQNPYGGSVSECQARAASQTCEAVCEPRLAELKSMDGNLVKSRLGTDRPNELRALCVRACESSKLDGVNRAAQYYNSELPARIAKEKQTLAELTGWSLHDIDNMPGARKYGQVEGNRTSVVAEAAPANAPSWWQQFLGRK